MKVFEACMLVIKRRLATFVLYFAVFVALSVVMTAMSVEQFTAGYVELKPNFTVINRDGDSVLSEGLVSYLRDHGSEVVLEDDKRTLQDATFYRATDYIVFLPQGFSETFLSGGTVELDTVTTTDSAKGYYPDSLVNQYLNLARVYLAADAGWGEETLVSAVLDNLSLEANAEKKRFGESAPIDLSYRIYSQMLCYILLVLNIVCVTNLTMVFRRPDLHMRNLCAPLKPRSFNGQQILSNGLLCVLGWLLLTATGFVLYGSTLDGADSRSILLILLNSLVFSCVAVSVAALAGAFVRSPAGQNAAANVVSLGLCFIGGVFVPLEMLSEGLLAVSRFMPTYWYITALDHIGTLTSFGAEALAPVWQAMLIQLAFAAAFFCVALMVGKHLSQSERSFGSIRTELEA